MCVYLDKGVEKMLANVLSSGPILRRIDLMGFTILRDILVHGSHLVLM